MPGVASQHAGMALRMPPPKEKYSPKKSFEPPVLLLFQEFSTRDSERN